MCPDSIHKKPSNVVSYNHITLPEPVWIEKCPLPNREELIEEAFDIRNLTLAGPDQFAPAQLERTSASGLVDTRMMSTLTNAAGPTVSPTRFISRVGCSGFVWESFSERRSRASLTVLDI